MRLRLNQIHVLAKHIVQYLLKKNLATFSKNEEEVVLIVAEIFKKNHEEEQELVEKAKKLLEQNKRKLGLNIDEEKALSMIKKQLAKDRNFVL